MATSRPASAASGMRPCFVSACAHQKRIAGDLRRNRAGSTSVRLLAAAPTRPGPGTRQPCRASAAPVGVAEAEVQVDGSRSREGSSGPQRSGPPAAVVTFRARRKLKYGQVLKVVGGPQQMGGWDCGRAPVMKWGEGDRWMLTLELPPGQHEYKVAVAKGHDPGFVLQWDEGPNRTLELRGRAGREGCCVGPAHEPAAATPCMLCGLAAGQFEPGPLSFDISLPRLQVSEAEAAARSTFLIDCDSGAEGDISYGGASETSSYGRGSEARSYGESSEASSVGGVAGANGASAGISAAAAGGPLGPAKAALAQPQALPNLAQPQGLPSLDELFEEEEEQLDELVALLQQERAARAAAESEIKALRRQVSTGVTEAAALVANSAALREEFAALAAQLDEAQAGREALQAERDALAAQLQRAEAAREALAAEREGLDGRLSWSEQSLATLQAERDRMAEEHAAAVARAAQLQAEREGAPQEMSAALARCDSLAAERDSLALQLADARRQLDEAREEAQEAQREAERAAQQRALLRSVGLLLSSFD